MSRSGDGEELDAFLRASQLSLSRLAFFLSSDVDSAEDLAQEAMARIASRWHQVRQADNPLAYAHRIVVNLEKTIRRRRLASAALNWPSGTIDQRVAGHEVGVVERVHLHAALQRLTPRQRAVLYLRYFEDQSVEQVAAAMGCSRGTVKSQTAHALKRLRELNPELAVLERG